MNDCKKTALHLITRSLCTAGLVLMGSIAGVSAQVINVDINAPLMDKNGYPHSPNGGGPRVNAFIFGAVGELQTDDRDSQFFNRFSTSATVPVGQGFANYQITSATFTISLASSGTFVFDGTYDSITTYDATGLPINGDDPGRPIELYGAAFRNGTPRATIDENYAFGPTDDQGKRNIYATDFQLGASLTGANRDVSNNVGLGFEAVPFAIGQIAAADLNPDGTAESYTDVVFTLNLTNPDVMRYLQLSLDSGFLDFMVTSLSGGAQGEGATYPEFFTKESLFPGAQAGRLDMQLTIVPEASAVTMFLCAFGLFVGLWRGRQAFHPGVSNS